MKKIDIVDIRGEIIINNIKLASKEIQSVVHDSQILYHLSCGVLII